MKKVVIQWRFFDVCHCFIFVLMKPVILLHVPKVIYTTRIIKKNCEFKKGSRDRSPKQK